VSGRKIIHIDMDCFYAAVEVKYQPRLKGLPLAVGGNIGGRGVLTTASYEARKFGVRSAMTASQALRLCPDLILLPPDFSKYKVESEKVRRILERYSNRIEPLSLDEAYLDVSNSEREGGMAAKIAGRIRKEIRDELELTASAGVAPNKFLAKIASDLNKPDGLAVIRPEQVEGFMKDLPIEKIWGVGKVTAGRLQRLGYLTCGDLQAMSLEKMTEVFGNWGGQLYGFCRGIDHRPVVSSRERKSLSVESTFGKNLVSRSQVLSELPKIYDDFQNRLSRFLALQNARPTQTATLNFRSIVVKLKFDNFRLKCKERHWRNLQTSDCPDRHPLNRDVKYLNRSQIPRLSEFRELIEEALDGETRSVRLLGIGVRFESRRSSKIENQLTVFDINGDTATFFKPTK
jgi:DNA polymerase-4